MYLFILTHEQQRKEREKVSPSRAGFVRDPRAKGAGHERLPSQSSRRQLKRSINWSINWSKPPIKATELARRLAPA